MIKRIFRRELSTEDLLALETRLQQTLTPVKPRMAYVAGLRDRLLNEVIGVESPVPIKLSFPLAVAGVLSAILIMVTSLRALITILGALGLLRSMRHQMAAKKKTVTVATVS